MIDFHKLTMCLERLCKLTDLSEIAGLKMKSENDFVTTTDYNLQVELSAILREYLDYPVLGEESINIGCERTETFWLVDPLDGTSNFINGISLIASSVALVQFGEVIYGFVYDFHAGTAYWAVRGHGSFKGEQKLLRIAKDSGPVLVGCSSGFLKFTQRNFSDEIESFFRGKNFRVLGSQALQLCYVAEGKLDVNFSVEARIWDDLASVVILTESDCDYYSRALEQYDISTCFKKNVEMWSVASNSQMGQDLGIRLMKDLNR